jgi:hypothetical protein
MLALADYLANVFADSEMKTIILLALQGGEDTICYKKT